MTPLVSVVIPTYNRPILLRHALASVACQRNVPGQVEAIVVNDGGADVDVAVNTAREHGLAVQLIRLTTNRGLPTARNIGMDTARGEYLAFLDDDDVYLPHHLAEMLHAIDKHGVDAAYGDCVVSTTRVDQAKPFAPSEHWSYPFDADLLSVANLIPVHSAVLRRPPTQARFDPAMPALEDWDMWLRLVREHAFRFHHVPVPTVVYHRIPDQDSMVGNTVSDAAALVGFGKLANLIWRRWPARTETAHRFRLYIAVMYWHALAMLTEGEPLADNYFLRCVGHLAAAWHGERPEDHLPDQIIEAIKDGIHAASA